MEKQNKKKRIEKLKRKYRLVLMDAATFEEKVSFRVTRLGVFLSAATTIILLISLTVYLLAFTGLREYIPGYTDVTLPKKIYDLQQTTDSLERVFRQKDLYISNIKRIIQGDSVAEIAQPMEDAFINYDTITLSLSREDSLLRAEYEEQTKYNLFQNRMYNYTQSDLGFINFFPPLKGLVSRSFNPQMDHYGVDLVAGTDQAIKATLDGTVIFSGWTIETGYVIGLQHRGNLISIYKHNSSLLKNQGAFVNAGETISILGESGELSTGPHLHFELWFNGRPIDPEEFITF
jgi:murein DD-endopeptidase MepM/ murein hydrolase activator NlpD